MPHEIRSAAVDDLARIYLDGIALFGSGQADVYEDGLYAAFDFLAANPFALRVRTELNPPLRAYRYKAHMIIFDVEADGLVMILRVRHGREDWLSDPLQD